MKAFFLTLVSFALLFLCQGTAFASTSESLAGRKIITVEVKGKNVKSPQRIKMALKTREGSIYNPAIADEDVKRLFSENLVEDASVFVEEVEGGVKLTFVVTEKRVISDILFMPEKGLYYTGTTLLDKILTKKGDFYSLALASQDEEIIVKQYQKKGYLKVRVTHVLEDAPDGVNLVYNIEPGPRYAISRILFPGAVAFSEKKLRRTMKTKKKDFFHGGYFDEDKLALDVDAVRRLYLDEGYLDVHVNVLPIQFPETPANYHYSDKLTFQLVIEIQEGRQYKVGPITFDGESVVSESELQSLMTLKTGDIARYAEVERSVKAIRERFGADGRAFTEVRPEIVPAENEGEVEIIMHINQSDVISVNEVIIEGNEVTKDNVIRREMRVYPGEKLTVKGLNTSFENLQGLGYFSNVSMSFAPRSEDTTDVIVRVEEGKTGSFMFGGGVSSDADVFANVSYTERNFDIGNWPKFRGGGQYGRLSFRIGTQMSGFVADYMNPHINDSDYEFGVGGSRTEYSRSTFDSARLEGHVSIGKHFGDFLSMRVVYTIENVKIDNLDASAPLPIQMDEGTHNLGSLAYIVTFRHIDNPFVPTSGTDARFAASIYNRILGSNYDFYKFEATYSRYFPMVTLKSGAVHTLMFQINSGYMKEYGDTAFVPTFERFYGGGIGSVRGWQPREIGPRIGEEAIGGNFKATATIEYSFPLYQDILYFATFFDAGGVWPQASDFESSGLRYGTGAGFYIKTPLSQAPLRLYYTHALNPKGDEDTQVIQFSFGILF
ncbi:MAG: outer membrane protein assembly factor BamA [Candidatus Brocadiia bacterium]